MATDATVRKIAGRGRFNEDYYPILEYEAPKAFFLGSVASLIRRYDERELPAGAGALYLTRYLRERQAPLSREELKNLIAYHRAYGSKKLAAAVVTDWVRRFPEDKDALWALAQTQTADGQLEPAMHTLRQLLREEPDNPHYLLMAADVELAYYQSQRSYLNGVSNQQTLALLQRLLALEVEDKAGVYRKMAHVHALDREYATALRLIEQAAELGLQKTAHAVSSDVLWVEAAQMAIELEDFGKARHYLTRALTQNPQNATARELMRGLPTHDMSRVERVAKE
jgi:predicted Zn-dependent protease